MNALEVAAVIIYTVDEIGIQIEVGLPVKLANVWKKVRVLQLINARNLVSQELIQRP